jgi:hypothetical protein
MSLVRPSPRRSRRTRCSISHTPASCHSLRRRQQVISDPHAISLGSISQGMPLLRTKMPPSVLRPEKGTVRVVSAALLYALQLHYLHRSPPFRVD